MAKENVVETTKFEGVLKSAFSHTEKDDNGNVTRVQNTINLFREGLTRDKFEDVDEFFNEFYEGKTKKWIPEWHKENKDFISLKSGYNIPCKLDETGEQMSFTQFVERGNIRGAKVIVKCNIKDTAVYPSAMLIVKDGEAYDAFKDF